MVKHLQKHGCQILREGKRHTIFRNLINRRQSSVGRHRELSDLLCSKVCKQLGVQISKNSVELRRRLVFKDETILKNPPGLHLDSNRWFFRHA